MMINKEQLLKIYNLKLSGIIDTMNDNQFDEYCKILVEFVGSFPAQETALKNFFEAKDYTSFAKVLLSIRSSLAKIYAEELMQDCNKLLNTVGTIKHENSEALLTYFLSSISILSIDIQMALYVQKDSNEAALPPTQPAEKDLEGDGKYRQKNILAVDDVSLLLNTLRGILQETKYKFIGVTSGDAALRFIQNHKPDLFLLDIEMPGMNGYELAVKLKESGQKAPIIFLTGNAHSNYVKKAVQVGAVDFIVKPVNREQVLEKIKKYIG